MAESRNTFTDSRMNQDLDARLIQPGTYRTATNIGISRSEGDNVGSLENVLGNFKVSDFGVTEENIRVIGCISDVVTNYIIVFLTNYTDNSVDNLSNFANAESKHYIALYNTNTLQSSILVSGNWLNFSTTHMITGVNMVESLLFWTDNRNQPRKINVETALNNSSYYYNEDHISVAKYYPFEPISLIYSTITSYSINSYLDPTSGQRADYVNRPDAWAAVGVNGAATSGQGLTFNVVATDVYDNPSSLSINTPGDGYVDGEVVWLEGSLASNPVAITLAVQKTAGMQDVVSEKLPDATNNNPYYDSTYDGDPEFMKDKFIRFAYRFKFDDEEYSLISPFTQECFVPIQDGYFKGEDEVKTYQSSENYVMENKINNVRISIPSPIDFVTQQNILFNDINDKFKVKAIDIIYKQSNESVLRVAHTIYPEDWLNNNSQAFLYNYRSSKPFKTLRESELLRVYDQVPVRALSQEIAANRVVYGNFIDKPTPPTALNYTVGADFKGGIGGAVDSDLRIEYQNHTLKQNRTYQAGVVLSDRYGRQSTTILSSQDNIVTPTGSTTQGSSYYHPYKTGSNTKSSANDFSYYSPTMSNSVPRLISTNASGGPDTWPGDALEMTFNTVIASTKNSNTGEPGLFSSTNPLGWNNWKVVVKQQEQEYYNVYFPGLLNGYIDGESKDPLSASSTEPIGHFALLGDNINKVPRDLSLLGPNQNIFRSGRPTFNEDPDYYTSTNAEGEKFTLDPYDPADEAVLKTKDRKRDLDSGSQVDNASIKVYPRVLNHWRSGIPASTDPKFISQYYNAQWYPGSEYDTIVTIGTGTELGLWSPAAPSPFDIAPVFYSYQNNPLIAKVELTDPTNEGVTGPSPKAGKLNYEITGVPTRGNNYVTGSKNLQSKAHTSDNPQQGLLFNITTVLDVNNARVSDEGTEGKIADDGIEISNLDDKRIRGFSPTINYDSRGAGKVDIDIIGGDNTGKVTVLTTKQEYPGKMVPQLSVYEVKPLTSKLDIYWETSTSGLISELNSNIVNNNLYLPTEIRSADVSYYQTEAMAQGTMVTALFKARNYRGDLINIEQASIVRVDKINANGSRSDVTSKFALQGPVSGQLRIKTNAVFNYGTVGEDYIFTLNIGTENDPASQSGSLLYTELTVNGTLANISPTAPSIASPQTITWDLSNSASGGTSLASILGLNGGLLNPNTIQNWVIYNVQPYNDIDNTKLPVKDRFIIYRNTTVNPEVGTIILDPTLVTTGPPGASFVDTPVYYYPDPSVPSNKTLWKYPLRVQLFDEAGRVGPNGSPYEITVVFGT